MRTLIKILLFTFSATIALSCKEDRDDNLTEPQIFDTLEIISATDFLFNIPINGDSILMDSKYGIDFRLGIEGCIIDSIEITIDNSWTMEYDTTIINTQSFGLMEGTHLIRFLFRTINLDNGDTVFFKSDQIILKVLENLSHRYINISDNDGRLNMSWPELDKTNTQYYLIERFLGNQQEFLHEIETNDSLYTDNYYVGEEVVFKISVINNEGGRQNIWYFKKDREDHTVIITPNPGGIFNLHFSPCKYYNNFGSYCLTTGYNYDPDIVYTSTNITDTTFYAMPSSFGSEEEYYIRCLPKDYPSGVSEENWPLYAHFLYVRVGEESFTYNRIAVVDENRIAYTKDGGIYLRNVETDQVIDSIIKEDAYYGFLHTTPAGNYIYAVDEHQSNPLAYFWSSNAPTQAPLYAFLTDYVVPRVSDNLIAVMSIPGVEVPTKLALYDVTDGSIIYTTEYAGANDRPKISSDGQYFFIDNSGLKLCHYFNDTFNVIWEESDWTKSYLFYDFNPNNGNCYTWDSEKKFSVRNTSDGSEINSFTVELEQIVNIDYYAERIMGYLPDQILIYSLVDGTLLAQIPANLDELFLYSNSTILIGNTLYSNFGVKYNILSK